MVEKRMVDRFFDNAGNEHADRDTAIKADITAALTEIFPRAMRMSAREAFTNLILSDAAWNDYKVARDRIKADIVAL